MSLWANIKFFPEPTRELYGWLLATLVLNLDFNIIAENKYFGKHEIWTYNLWTEQWKEHTIHPARRDLVTTSKIGVAIASDVYILGGRPMRYKNLLWKLTRCNNGSFASTTVYLTDKTYCSRRLRHCDWEHGKKLWIFGIWWL